MPKDFHRDGRDALLYFGSIAGGVIALAVISQRALLCCLGRQVPETLTNWGGVIIGVFIWSSIDPCRIPSARGF